MFTLTYQRATNISLNVKWWEKDAAAVNAEQKQYHVTWNLWASLEANSQTHFLRGEWGKIIFGTKNDFWWGGEQSQQSTDLGEQLPPGAPWLRCCFVVSAAIELLILDIDHVCLIVITHGNLHHQQPPSAVEFISVAVRRGAARSANQRSKRDAWRIRCFLLAERH